MRLLERFWTTATYVLHWLTNSPVGTPQTPQAPLGGNLDTPHDVHHPHAPIGAVPDIGIEVGPPRGPGFKPPTGRPPGRPGSDFLCEYPTLVDYVPCSTPYDRGCWLLNRRTLQEYNIHTDYENIMPKGIDRYYTLRASDGPINADGMVMQPGKRFNSSFPGPWIQACWGDTLHVTVINDLTENGTSIHWHGIRQLNSMQSDGVNGVTQCPIAPGDRYTYVMNLTQYGSSWYHSHYSVQYADGLQGPITIHGPSSANYDEAKFPLIMTDWGHNSAFEAIYRAFFRLDPDPLGKPSILLNGTGNVTRFSGNRATALVPSTFQMTFDPPGPFGPRRYLLRLINTAFETTFTFSIDNHLLKVIAADFVPIVPYFTRSVTVSIGQRYNIIVVADQWRNSDTNFWIRTTIQTDCPGPDVIPGSIEGYERTGILRYDASSKATPTSFPWRPDYIKTCEDEPAASLVPILPWNVGKAANGAGDGEEFGIGFRSGANQYPLKLFNFNPESSTGYNFQINYSEPILLDLEHTGSFPNQWVVVPENYKDTDWVYLVLSGNLHPIHLHGHDFAILQVSKTPYQAGDITKTCPGNENFTCINPARRDVVMLPPGNGGYVVIAFKADNPGSWLMHCHIAYHASGGLALQILERLPDAKKNFPPNGPARRNAQKVCDKWTPWWEGNVQDDSGI